MFAKKSFDTLTPDKLIDTLPGLIIEVENQKKELIGSQRKAAIVEFLTDIILVQRELNNDNPEIVALLNASLIMLPFAIDAMVGMANNGYLFVRTRKCCMGKSTTK